MQKRKDFVAYAFIAPFILLSVLFMLVPILRGMYNSFFDFRWGNEFVGIKNYLTVFTEPIYIKSIITSLVIVAIVVPSLIVFGILISGSVFDKRAGYVSFVRICLYVPVIASLVVMSIIWRFMLDSQTGLIRYFYDISGLPAFNLFGDQGWSLGIVIFILFSVNIGQAVVLYVAAMISIPKDLSEALVIDGGNRSHLFLNLLIPLTKPTSLFIFITQTSALLRTFVVIQLLTNGGPHYSTTTMMYLLYQDGFTNGNFGLASALGVVMFLITLILVFFQFKSIRMES